MGDCGDLSINEGYEKDPLQGETCIQISYAAKGLAPNNCSYYGACKWAGIYWQNKPNNWGKTYGNGNKGYNLSPYNRLTFWAKAEKKTRIEFKVGGINERFGDSQKYPVGRSFKLTKEWQKYTIPLDNADLTHIIGGLCVVTNMNANPSGATIYLDEIRYETTE